MGFACSCRIQSVAFACCNRPRLIAFLGVFVCSITMPTPCASMLHLRTYLVCNGVWVCGCVGVWVCGCVGVWVCGCVGVWVCGCVLCAPSVTLACWPGPYKYMDTAVPAQCHNPQAVQLPDGTFAMFHIFNGTGACHCVVRYQRFDWPSVCTGSWAICVRKHCKRRCCRIRCITFADCGTLDRQLSRVLLNVRTPTLEYRMLCRVPAAGRGSVDELYEGPCCGGRRTAPGSNSFHWGEDGKGLRSRWRGWVV